MGENNENAVDSSEETIDTSFLDDALGDINGVSREQAAAFNSSALQDDVDEGETEGEVVPTEAEDATTPADGADDSEPVTPDSEQPTVAPDDAAIRHRETMDAHNELMKRLASQNAPAEEKTDKPAEAEVPSYMFDIPDGLIAAIGSEDPAEVKQGVQGLAAGIARTIHANMQQNFAAMVESRFGGLNETIVETIQTRELSKTVYEDFYGKYPEFNKPELYPVILQVAQGQLKAAGDNAQWNDKLRDSIADKAYALLGIPKAAKGEVVAATPPAKLGGGNKARPAGAGRKSLDARVMDELFDSI